jgi:L-fuculose-phosphate aldolase
MAGSNRNRDDELKTSLAQAYNTLHGLDIFDYAGDVSVRSTSGDTYLIRAARVSLGALTHRGRVRTSVDDILTLTLSGDLVSGNGEIPIEAPIHGAIYSARSDVGSVNHCHPKMATVLSIANRELRSVFIRGVDVIGSGLPAYPNGDPIATREAADELVSILGQRSACVLPAHGVVVVGESLAQSCMRVVNLEQSATMQFLAHLVGRPSELPAASIKTRVRMSQAPEFFNATWGYYTELTASSPTLANQTTDSDSRESHD